MIMKCRDEITQVVEICDKEKDGSCVLQNTRACGFRKTLQKGYMKPVRQHLERVKKEAYLGKSNIILLAPTKFLARQAALTIENMTSGQEIDDDSYNAFYEELDDEVDDKLDGVITPCDEIIIMSEHEKKLGESGENYIFDGFVNDRNEEKKRFYAQKYNNFLLEYDMCPEQEKIINAVTALEGKRIYISLPKNCNCDYLIRRLTFEKNFVVIELEEPEEEAYLSYAKDYVSANCYHVNKDALRESIRQLKIYRGECFTETDIYTYLDKVFQKIEFDVVANNKNTITAKDLQMETYHKEKSGKQKLKDLIGLTCVKEVVKRQVCKRKVLNDTKGTMTNHMIFAGPPGVGKSVTARIYAKILVEENLSNGRFVDASKSDLVAKYVGQTAPKIREVFEKANGGVIFVDEASFLLGNDIFIKEAVTEFVRYMELCPQTTVIFATYPEEAKELLHCDPGFASRISKIIEFPTYSKEELFDIFVFMAKNNKFSIEENVRESIYRYVDMIGDKENFGNAREMRKLLDVSVEEFSLAYRKNSKFVLKKKHIDAAIAYMMKNENFMSSQRKIGFHVSEEGDVVA